MLSGLKSLSLLALLGVVEAARPGLPPPGDPFADPYNDPYNPLRYIPSNVLTGVSFGLYFLTATALALCMRKWGAKWMLCLIIGSYTFSLGLALRFGLAKDPHSKGIYIAEYLFVVLSPCAFLAADYILLGRLVTHLNADQYLFIRPDRVMKIFLASDLFTFAVQACGGGMSTSNDLDKLRIGQKLFLTGLALQLASFALFSALYIVFLIRVYKFAPEIWHHEPPVPWHRNWKTLTAALGLSCVGILIRSVFRTIELSEGYRGHLATTESLFYGLDTYSLFVAVAIYVPFWPGRFITQPGDGEVTRRGSPVEEKA
ncbi:Protein RTA1 [Saccharomyces cerevisiae S288c] [Rhizoctonia solani]|uniref:Protein RTA1 [Saccharomyces cerevisiae S288c] n=1 Tax=Rhizoctonia solani TaxID=456999 RepID=A0A0K6FNT2_9AGAM|nr:Protein RTA1 [Saccharomyces cerevisiae S288c] [Rhizoctonia solani]